MVGAIIAIVVTVIMAKCILMRLRPQFVVLFGGLLLLFIATALGPVESILPKKVASTGFWLFDPFKCMSSLFSSRTAGLGLIIMSATGYAKYMDVIGASKVMSRVMTSPLKMLKSPYLVVGLSYIIGQVMNVFIPSAAGLGTLLMVTMYPVLVRLGVSPLSATALVGTTACLDLGPASGNANLAAKNAGLDTVEYFVTYQIPVAIATMIVIAVLHIIVQKYYDKKEGFVPDPSVVNDIEEKNDDHPPFFYFFLPILPLALLLIFSRFAVSSIKLDVPTAMFFSFILAILFELVRHRHSIKKVLDDAMDFYNLMGKQFAMVMTLIIAGEVFAQGLMATGTVKLLIDSVQGSGWGGVGITIAMTLLISITAIVMGSGNAPFFAFASLAPTIATDMSISAVSILLPMQLAAGIARSVSPITGVIVAVSGMANVSPFDVVRRTAIPMIGGLIVMTAMSVLLF